MSNETADHLPAIGRVYLIGAGPGDPELLTLRGLRCLREAEVIIYDYLAHPDLLREASPSATLIYAGKRGGAHTLRQPEINRLLVEQARAGRVVARLKGGDPFVFGRGGEEAEVLAAANVPWEVIPGVSAAIAVPAYAGIPVTHRDYSASFAVVTGHEDPTKERNPVDWAGLATGPDTLLLLMGVANLAAIVDQLLRHGRAAETPTALIQWGTHARQRTLVDTLGNIATRAAEAHMTPPAMLVVGEVVRLRQKLRWFDKRPLAGLRLLLCAPTGEMAHVGRRLRALGADLIGCPSENGVSASAAPLTEALTDALTDADWLLLAGSSAVAEVRQALADVGRDWRALAGVRVAAIDTRTAAALHSWGLEADVTLKLAGRSSLSEGEQLGGSIVLVDPHQSAADVEACVCAQGTHMIRWQRELRQAGTVAVTARRLLLEEPPDGILLDDDASVQALQRMLETAGQSWDDFVASGIPVIVRDAESEQRARACGVRVTTMLSAAADDAELVEGLTRIRR